MASGPSLTPEDCETVRQSGHPSVVTNTTFRLAPWADVVFGMDVNWWREYHREVEAICSGRKLSTSHAARAYGAESLWQCGWFPNTLNSGQAAITLAMVSGAEKIVLLGYDCQKTGGKSHHHGDHPNSLGNAGSLKRWPRHFEIMARDAQRDGVVVLNATRETALKCFPRVSLESAL
jgi:hypothetical protein